MSAPLRTSLAWLFGLFLLLPAVPAFAQAAASTPFKPVPALSAHVTDEVGMLAPDQRARLEAALGDYEHQTGSQIAVLLVASTEPEAIEQYSIRVTDAWKLGRKGVDDGVLLVVARDNPKALRRLRIEAGRGVQGVLTDAQSKRILQDIIAPHFRQNDYYGGLVAGVGAIEALLHQESFPAPLNQDNAQAGVQQAADDNGGPGVVLGIVLLIIGFTVLRSIFRPRSARFARPGRGGVGGDGWGSGAAGFILGNIVSAALSGGSRGGSGGGLSGGGGGFSGGGGGFDGGGASGDW
jgi:uncharacterized protein